MKITQITHNDLDGYGASAVVEAYVEVERVIHVARYRDMAGIFSAEVNRLAETDAPEMVIITDISLEQHTVETVKRFAAMNAERPGREHRLVVMDHHASSHTWLTALGFHPLAERDARHPQACYFTVPSQPLRDAARPDLDPVVVLIDTTRSATKIAHHHAALYAGPDCQIRITAENLAVTDAEPAQIMHYLVEGVDAVDLWLRDRPAFDAGEALNEAFWEVVNTFVPEGHELHDAFVSQILFGVAGLAALNSRASGVETSTMSVRQRVVNALIHEAELDETSHQRAMTSRMRVSRLIGRSHRLFVDLPGLVRAKMAFAMESGIFQRVSDEMLREDRAALVINVFRGGQMSLRSRDGEALALAKKLGGGGHPNAAGATLNVTGVFSLADAQAVFVARIGDAQVKA